jgi:predicted GIY-YIG superfamily endonuclease
MYSAYILLSSKSHIFYFGSTNDLRKRLKLHNEGKVASTKPYLPWELVWYGAFTIDKKARDFKLYLKSGSGKAFAYKRFVSVALKKDLFAGRKGHSEARSVG